MSIDTNKSSIFAPAKSLWDPMAALPYPVAITKDISYSLVWIMNAKHGMDYDCFDYSNKSLPNFHFGRQLVYLTSEYRPEPKPESLIFANKTIWYEKCYTSLAEH